MQYRMGRDIMDPNFLGPRIMDKFVLALIVMSLYWKVCPRHTPPPHTMLLTSRVRTLVFWHGSCPKLPCQQTCQSDGMLELCCMR